MQEAATQSPRKGYHNHHVLEQQSARDDGFLDAQIGDRGNIVRIPTLKHYEITGWYARPNREFGSLSPRQYLRGKNWEERARIGRDALIKHKVVKP